MRSAKLLYWLTFYYLLLSVVLLAAAWVYPDVGALLPIGGMETLLGRPDGGLLGSVSIDMPVGGLGASVLWMFAAILGAVLAALPVSWTYMEIRARDGYDQSLVETIVVLPLVVTAIVVVVHNSLALAFSLAGIAAGVRFRHALKSPGDVLFILLAIAIGLASGIGAVELAIVVSLAFNYCFLFLWINDYGARRGTRRYLRKERSEEVVEPLEPTEAIGNPTADS